MWIRIGNWIYLLRLNHNKFKISSSTSFALELATALKLEFLWDLLASEILN
jgi:hypothetical protein